MKTATNDKTAEEILVQHSPNPKGGYRGSWIINAMHDYSAQQLKEYKEKLKEAMEKKWSEYYITDPGATEAFPEVIKLIDQTDTK